MVEGQEGITGMSKIKSMSAAVCVVIDKYPTGHRFHGNQLKDDVVKIYPAAKDCYVDTVQRMMRRHRKDAYRTVNQNKSLYEKVTTKSIIEQIREVAPKPKPVKPTVERQLLLFG